MSVTIYLTDHNGRKIAFFYRIDNERYSLTPKLLWCCRNYPEYQGTAESKEHFIEQAKGVIKELNRSPKVCKDELLMSEASNGVRSEAKPCDTCGLTNPKLESQDACPECLTDKTTTK